MVEDTIQQLVDAIAHFESRFDSLESKYDSLQKNVDSLRTDFNGAEQKAEQRNKTLRKEIRRLRERGSQDRDRLEMLKNQVQGFVTLGGGRGPGAGGRSRCNMFLPAPG